MLTQKNCSKHIMLLLTALVLLFTVTFLASAENAQKAKEEIIYQISTYNSLNNGGFEGIVPLKDITKHGDFGIGTFEGINGEMVFVDGIIYQVTVDGKVHAKQPNELGKELTPYAVVTFFDTDKQVTLDISDSYSVLQDKIAKELVNPNHFYCIRVDGTFDFIKTRSVPAQNKPYPPLSEVVKQQATFEFNNVKGTLVGLWCPQWVGGVNVAGFHLHFLTADRQAGGHVLELKLKDGTLKIDDTSEFFMRIDNN